MTLENQIAIATQNADEYYKYEKENILISHEYGESCFCMICYDLSCGCQQTKKCDVNEGETIKSIYSDAIEIEKEEFIELFSKCYKNHYQVE